MDLDPVDVGVRLHVPLMERIAAHVSSQQELTIIARMIDAFAASLQVKTMEQGLGAPVEAVRQAIKEKLQSLSLMPEREAIPVSPDDAFSSESPCFCEKDQDGECHACRKELVAFGTEFSTIQTAYLSQIDKIGGLSERVPCHSCVLKYTDLAMSEVFMSVGKVLPSNQQNVGLAMYAAFYQMLGGMGVQTAPMLDKAWKELKESKGWL